MKKNKIILFAAIPILTNLLFIGLYFSGIEYAQQIVAPTIDWLSSNSWREFGILEQLQNIYLLTIIIIFVIGIFKKTLMFKRILFISGFLVILFIFLEEIDYGIHFYDFFIGHSSAIDVRNWHNQETFTSGKQNVAYLKQIIDFIMIIWFVLLPIFSYKISYSPIKKLIPSPWFIIGFIISFLCSRFAHFLQDMGWDVINSISGNLHNNISEFRETTNYYLYMLYVIQLFNTNFNYTNSHMGKPLS